MHIRELDTPAVLIDLDVMERNLRRAQEYCDAHGIRLRPHIKTHKIPQIAELQKALGAVGITCAKLGEAEVMFSPQVQDILIAYPIVGEAKLRRFVELAGRCRLSTAFDSLDVAEGLSRALSAAGETAGVLVEVDTGTRRCGVPAGQEAVDLCRRVADLPGLRFEGLLTYQGYVRGPEPERRAAMARENERVNALLDRLAEAGLECRTVSGGTSPSLYFSHLLERVNENRCGTYVFNDRNMVGSGTATWDDCAMRIAVTVVSTAVPGQLIIDGGSKTFHSDTCAEFPGFGRFSEDPDLCLEKMNEEHGYVSLGASRQVHRIGDRLTVIPNHVCVAMNMHDEVWVHRRGEVVDCWRVAARGKVR